jgi:hypothetical protein
MHVATSSKTLIHMRHLGQTHERAARQLGVLILVLSAHALVVIVLGSSGRVDRRRSLSPIEHPTTLVWLELESPTVQPEADQGPKRHPSAGAHSAHEDRARGTSGAAASKSTGEESDSTAIHPEAAPRIDWHRELDDTVEALMPKMIREYTRLCAETERPQLKHAPGCPRSRYEGWWRPSGDLRRDLRDPDRPHTGMPGTLPPAFVKAPESLIRIRPPDP